MLVKNITRGPFPQIPAKKVPFFSVRRFYGTTGNRSVPLRCNFASIFPAMAANIRDLKVWQEAVSLAAETVKCARQSARRETKVVNEQLMLTALGIASTIADGYGRYTAPEQRQLYRAAKRDLLRLETQLAIARQADLLSAQVFSELSARIASVTRLLGGYLVYLERQLSNENGSSNGAARAAGS